MSTEVWFQNSVDFLSFQEKLHRRDQLIWVNQVFHWVFAIQFRVSHTGVHHHMNVNLWFVWKWMYLIWVCFPEVWTILFYSWNTKSTHSTGISKRILPPMHYLTFTHCILLKVGKYNTQSVLVLGGGGGHGDMGHSTPQMFYFALFFCFLAIPMGSEVLFFLSLLSSFKLEMRIFFLVMTTPPPFENQCTATAHNNHDIPHQIYFGYHCPSVY